MTLYSGQVKSYGLSIQSPNVPTNYKGVITLLGDFGRASLYFVPQDGQLGNNQKRAGQNIFDIFFWMYSWPHFTDMLRNEKPIVFFYNDAYNTVEIKTIESEPVGEAEGAP